VGYAGCYCPLILTSDKFNDPWTDCGGVTVCMNWFYDTSKKAALPLAMMFAIVIINVIM